MSTSPPDHESDQIEPERNPHQLRKFLIALPIVVVIAFAATLAVGPLKGSSSSSSGNATTASTPTEGCTSGPAGSNVRVTIYGNGEAACSEFNQGAAKSTGDFWKTKPQGEELQGELVCSMSKGGSLVIEVRDTGEHLYGNKICASLTAKGWHEAEGPGAQVERKQAKQKSEREQTAAAEQNARTEREDQKRQKEEAQQRAETKKQEAKQHQEQQEQEAGQHREQQRQEAESRKQLKQDEEENARDDKRNEEETKRAEQEAQRGE